MASPEVTLSTAAVDSTKEPLDSSSSADSSLLLLPHAAVLQTYLTSGNVSELAPGPIGDELLQLPWLSDSGVLDVSISPAVGKEDGFSGMDWMAEHIDLSEFDLDSLIGSYESDEPPSSPEELIASLGSHMDLDLQFPATATSIASPLEELVVPQLDLPLLSPLHSPEPQQEMVMKSEPASPAPSPSPLPPLLPTYTLELGSEVDVAENERATPGIIFSLSTSHIVVLLAPKEELAAVSPDDLSDSDSGIESVSGSPRRSPCSTPPPSTPAPPPTPQAASRPKPYSILSKSEPAAKPGKVKAPSAAPVVVEKKLKKMEQNKTAATRYRQKKRVEQDTLSDECGRLEQRNQELNEKADSISKEIQYLKGLIEEVRNAKNRRKSRPEQL
ncbi:hypothetical protein SKAU_G00120650 [Synaphobranchus kaupii]|uniref:Cyclic AMP-dependent transcription factor ATF-4 n=1 Tax=Synaphobranchus kaupii TaxID=118154 RepID=A0A9Q1FNQ6_SYNKA|nr:hypothetical protein SKAU_G00120650 [Synaphobranchus kaupii]